MNNTDFELLKQREIIDILIGDVKIIDDLSMPYLSGPNLCEISNKFGLPEEYSFKKGFVNKSRWQYMDNLLKHSISNNTISTILNYIFSITNFSKTLSNLSTSEIKDTHEKIVSKCIEHINGILYFGKHELKKIENNFIIINTDSKIEITSPSIKSINAEYIKNLPNRCETDILQGNYDSAITKARTMLEEIFIYVLENNNIIPTDTGNINKLYNQVKDHYKMHQGSEVDKRINNLLSGLEKIITSITEMRNINSDSHGVGSKRIAIKSYHAKLFVNSATMLCEFILDIYINNK